MIAVEYALLSLLGAVILTGVTIAIISTLAPEHLGLRPSVNRRPAPSFPRESPHE